ncbi:hypothetical protein Taro_040208 [Colocasia esculenta]|uniref:Uncharacterized protein n=1 Tax=Colocasia esculenta TaxID=4460 RepID=A0A843WCK6_COLES|nr:hypothetical protein [Colocasia esculenta]
MEHPLVCLQTNVTAVVLGGCRDELPHRIKVIVTAPFPVAMESRQSVGVRQCLCCLGWFSLPVLTEGDTFMAVSWQWCQEGRPFVRALVGQWPVLRVRACLSLAGLLACYKPGVRRGFVVLPHLFARCLAFEGLSRSEVVSVSWDPHPREPVEGVLRATSVLELEAHLLDLAVSGVVLLVGPRPCRGLRWPCLRVPVALASEGLVIPTRPCSRGSPPYFLQLGARRRGSSVSDELRRRLWRRVVVSSSESECCELLYPSELRVVFCKSSGVVARRVRAVAVRLALDSLAVVFLVWRMLASQSSLGLAGCELWLRCIAWLPCVLSEVCCWFGWCVLEGFSQSDALVVLVEVLPGPACVASAVLLAAVFSLMSRIVVLPLTCGRDSCVSPSSAFRRLLRVVVLHYGVVLPRAGADVACCALSGLRFLACGFQ